MSYALDPRTRFDKNLLCYTYEGDPEESPKVHTFDGTFTSYDTLQYTSSKANKPVPEHFYLRDLPYSFGAVKGKGCLVIVLVQCATVKSFWFMLGRPPYLGIF